MSLFIAKIRNVNSRKSKKVNDKSILLTLTTFHAVFKVLPSMISVIPSLCSKFLTPKYDSSPKETNAIFWIIQ